MAKIIPIGDKKKDAKELFGLPTATVIHSRLPIFQASRKVRKIIKKVFKNHWGSVEITGRLGQNHRDLHDVIMTQGESYKLGEFGDLHIIIDPAKIRKMLNIHDTKLLDTLLDDMEQTKVNIKIKTGASSLGGIISVVDKKYMETPGPGGIIQKRFLWLITISRTWMYIYNTEIRIRYVHALPIILVMRSGYAQAMARFFLTHQGKMSMEFKNCLQALGISRDAKFIKWDIKDDLDKLKELGITIDGNMIHYEQQEGMVSFENPKKILMLPEPKPEE